MLRKQAVLVTGVGGSSNQWQTQQQAYLARKAGIHVCLLYTSDAADE